VSVSHLCTLIFLSIFVANVCNTKDYFEYRRRTYIVTITHSPITLANLSSINLVFKFRCSSSPSNPVYVRRVDPSTLACSPSSHRSLRITLSIDDTPISSRSHTHPSHSQTSRILAPSLNLGVPVPRQRKRYRKAYRSAGAVPSADSPQSQLQWGRRPFCKQISCPRNFFCKAWLCYTCKPVCQACRSVVTVPSAGSPQSQLHCDWTSRSREACRSTGEMPFSCSHQSQPVIISD
jgi:hypothetical protein